MPGERRTTFCSERIFWSLDISACVAGLIGLRRNVSQKNSSGVGGNLHERCLGSSSVAELSTELGCRAVWPCLGGFCGGVGQRAPAEALVAVDRSSRPGRPRRISFHTGRHAISGAGASAVHSVHLALAATYLGACAVSWHSLVTSCLYRAVPTAALLAWSNAQRAANTHQKNARLQAGAAARCRVHAQTTPPSSAPQATPSR